MFKRLAAALLLRRIARALDLVAAQLATQNLLLARLADHWAPIHPVVDRATREAESGVSYLDPQEAYLAANYIARTQEHTGHIPTDEEVLTHLSDEKTRDLAQRLSERDVELARLAEERRW